MSAIDELNQDFGQVFALKHDRINRFKIVEKDCFVRVNGTLMIYVYIEHPERGWLPYSKATIEECRENFVPKARC